MTLSPERRQRIIHAQLLQQRGYPLRQIADYLDVSHATIHADLQLFNQSFPQIAQITAHEHTFERLEYIADQLRQLASQDPLEPLLKYSRTQDERVAPLVGEVTTRDIVRLYGQHRTLTIALLREHRLTVDKLESAALTRLTTAEQADHHLDQAEQDLTESTDSDHPETPRPDREAAPEPPTEQISANHPDTPVQPSRAQRRRAEALARKAEKRQRKQQRTAVA